MTPDVEHLRVLLADERAERVAVEAERDAIAAALRVRWTERNAARAEAATLRATLRRLDADAGDARRAQRRAERALGAIAAYLTRRAA